MTVEAVYELNGMRSEIQKDTGRITVKSDDVNIDGKEFDTIGKARNLLTKKG